MACSQTGCGKPAYDMHRTFGVTMDNEKMEGGDRDRASSADVDMPPMDLHLIQSIFKNNPAFVVIIDPDGKLISMNDTMAEALGYSIEEFKGLDYMSTFVPEREWEMLSSIFKELTGPHHNTSNENHVLTREGKEILVKWNGSPHFNNKGDFEFFLRVGIDITQQRETEKALQESEEKFRGVIEKSYEGFLLTDEEGKVIIWNEASEHITGLKQEDVLGKLLCDVQQTILMKEDDGEIQRDRFCSIVKQILNTGASPLLNKPNDLEYKRPDGSIRYAQQVFFSSKTNAGYRLGAITQDITERKKAEEALIESEEMFRNAFDHAAIGRAMARLDGGFERVNQSWCEMFGYRMEEVQNLSWMSVTHPDHIGETVPYIKKLMGGKINNFTLEQQMVRKDGEVFWAHLNVVLSRDPSGNPTYMIGDIIDITDRRNAQNKLLEEKMKTELYLDILGHDINNQNQGILTLLELFLLEYSRDGPGRSDIEQALHQAFSISDLIRNVKTISGIDDARIELEPVDALASIERAMKKVRITYPGKDIILNTNGGEQRPRVMANGLLESLIINILGNAVKFDKADPVKLELDIRPENDGFWRFQFSDRGTGVPDNMKEEIFTRLIRGNQSSHGSGLGLAIVSGVTKQYGGRVWVEDRVKGDHTQGARFVLLLPKGGSK